MIIILLRHVPPVRDEHLRAREGLAARAAPEGIALAGVGVGGALQRSGPVIYLIVDVV